MLKPILALISLASLCAGCAGLTVKRAEDGDEGVRFRRPKPYLVLTRGEVEPSDGQEKKGGGKEAPAVDASAKASGGEPTPVKLTAKIVMLPDPDPAQEYVIDWNNGWFGSVSPKFTLTDGWNLTGMDSSVEAGGSAALTSLAEVVGSIADFAAAPGTPTPPGIYPLELDPGTKQWRLGPALLEFETN